MEIEPELDELPCEYRGQQGALFKLALKTTLLTLATLGVYRFWAKTRIRKYYWSGTAPGGDPLEYTGTGLEKLLGFLIAVAFLAVYLGLFQLLLSFVGMSVFNAGDGPEDIAMQVAVAQTTLIAVLPFIFYAQYRARRYILSRTRWRGIRFGVEPAAWGYVWRALGHWALTLVTFGLLLPRQTFWLEKYKIDRTWYGNAKFQQNGRWQMLYPAMKHLLISLAILIGSAFLLGATEQPIWAILTFIGVLWMYYGLVYYSVTTFRILANNKQLGDTVAFIAEPRPGKVFGIYVLGGILTSVCAGIFFSAFSIIAINVMGGVDGLESLFEPGSGLGSSLSQIIGAGLFGLGYLAMLIMSGVFAMIFITQPILEHYVKLTRIQNASELHDIEQRSRDEMVEAEGFADALDVGAAI
ncbi:MAG: DUF898 domain-containing protein [Rhodobacteraceae bacterium]|nr:DUF898 domain-containing protein [Paracoccaceae bacterium]